MHDKVASGILLALGMIEMAGVNLLLVPRLADRTAAPSPPIERCVTESPVSLAPPAPQAAPNRELLRAEPARDAAPPLAETRPASIETVAAAAAQHRAAPDVQFAFSDTRIQQASAVNELQRVARALAADPRRRLLLRGHADSLGMPTTNLALSRRRAAVVKWHLVWRGAPADRIAIEAVGAVEPADPDRTPSAFARARRVELLWR